MKLCKCGYCGKTAVWRDIGHHVQFLCPQCANKYLGKNRLFTTYSSCGFKHKDFEKKYILPLESVNNAYINNSGVLPKENEKLIEDLIYEIYFFDGNEDYVDFNKFMSRVGNIFAQEKLVGHRAYHSFYKYFKNELAKEKIEVK